MFKGFYNLTSGMINQGKKLDVISNNMTNVSTAGYKNDTYVGQTFDEVVYERVGNRVKDYGDIGNQSYATVPSNVYTDYTQGALDPTEQPLDYAIEGEGYFAIKTDSGIEYTRNGSFNLDEEGYLCLAGHGRVLDVNGDEILLITDKVQTDAAGNITTTEDGEFLGQIGVYKFPEGSEIKKNRNGLFSATGEPELSDATIHEKMVERSNSDLVEQMTNMMSSQRAFQSAAEALKIYDSVLTKATESVGRMA